MSKFEKGSFEVGQVYDLTTKDEFDVEGHFSDAQFLSETEDIVNFESGGEVLPIYRDCIRRVHHHEGDGA